MAGKFKIGDVVRLKPGGPECDRREIRQLLGPKGHDSPGSLCARGDTLCHSNRFLIGEYGPCVSETLRY